MGSQALCLSSLSLSHLSNVCRLRYVTVTQATGSEVGLYAKFSCSSNVDFLFPVGDVKVASSRHSNLKWPPFILNVIGL